MWLIQNKQNINFKKPFWGLLTIIKNWMMTWSEEKIEQWHGYQKPCSRMGGWMDVKSHFKDSNKKCEMKFKKHVRPSAQCYSRQKRQK